MNMIELHLHEMFVHLSQAQTTHYYIVIIQAVIPLGNHIREVSNKVNSEKIRLTASGSTPTGTQNE